MQGPCKLEGQLHLTPRTWGPNQTSFREGDLCLRSALSSAPSVPPLQKEVPGGASCRRTVSLEN